MSIFNELREKLRTVLFKKKQRKKRYKFKMSDTDLVRERREIHVEIPEPAAGGEYSSAEEGKVRKTCVLCLDPVVTGQDVYICRCGAAMHRACMGPLNIKVCPNCKEKIS